MSEPFRIGYTNDFLAADGSIGWGDIGLSRLEGLPSTEFEFIGTPEAVLTPEVAGGYDALGVLAPKVTAEFLDNAPNLAVVARFGVGYDSVDLEASTRNGVAVAITPDGVRRPVASSALAFLMALAHRIPDKDRITRAGEWGSKLDYMGFQITGRTLGTIGLGNIAREFFRLAAPFEMRQIAYDPYLPKEIADEAGVELVDLDTVMSQSDFLVVLCNLTDETHHLVNAERLAMMKPESHLISIARGPVIDEPALYEVLRDRRIRGAAMDVFEQEPPDPNNPIFGLDNVIVAPHALAWTEECAMGNGTGVLEAILDVREGRVPTHVVNREVIESPKFQEKLAANKARLEG